MKRILEDKDRALLLSAFLIGLLTPILPTPYSALWSVVPLLSLEARSRRAAFLVSCYFYLALSRGIVPGAAVFFRDGSLIRALTLWTGSALALAAPWAFAWGGISPVGRMVKGILAFSVSLFPPLGLIGWGSPLVAAGLFMPGCRWLGLLVLFLLCAIVSASRLFRLMIIFLVVLVVPFLKLQESPKPEGISGIDTKFGRLASGSADFDEQYKRERQVFAELLRRRRAGEFQSSDVFVLPETISGRLHPTTRRRWRDFFVNLDKNKIFIVGGEIPKGKKYDNVMIAFNDSEEQAAIQRCPVPFSMYRPFSEWGANADVWGSGKKSLLKVKGVKTGVGVLICYEQFLTWPFLSLMTQNPSVIVVPANFWWCTDTSLPAVRNRTIKLLAALFDVSFVSAINEL